MKTDKQMLFPKLTRDRVREGRLPDLGSGSFHKYVFFLLKWKPVIQLERLVQCELTERSEDLCVDTSSFSDKLEMGALCPWDQESALRSQNLRGRFWGRNRGREKTERPKRIPRLDHQVITRLWGGGGRHQIMGWGPSNAKWRIECETF